jgi:RimJ/RimL family protein N-acetyltransferase
MPTYPQPTLTEGDLTLRPPRLDDVPAITAACQDPEIPRWTRVPSPYTEDDAREWIEKDRDGVRAVVVGADGRFLGMVGLLELEARPHYAEMGYWIAPWARGQGVAGRAVALLRDWATAELGLTLVEILIHRDNAASHRVPPRAGFEATGEVREPPERLESDAGPVFVVYAWRAPSDS